MSLIINRLSLLTFLYYLSSLLIKQAVRSLRSRRSHQHNKAKQLLFYLENCFCWRSQLGNPTNSRIMQEKAKDAQHYSAAILSNMTFFPAYLFPTGI